MGRVGSVWPQERLLIPPQRFCRTIDVAGIYLGYLSGGKGKDKEGLPGQKHTVVALYSALLVNW